MRLGAFYNEIEPYPAAWLENLIAAGHIALGRIDSRSIRDVRAKDLHGATQAHFFAGIGVWSYALRLAGWPDDVPVWTGSCPCQPFSPASRRSERRGFDDERHLWPEWFRLIQECRPPIIFGEQVSYPDGLAWFDVVSANLEGAGYAVGALDCCAASVGAPHIRQRLYFAAIDRTQKLADADSAGRAGQSDVRVRRSEVPDADGRGESVRGFWAGAEWTACRDGKRRPTQSGAFPLAPRAPGRVGRLRAYGGAIVAPLAATFVRSVMDVLGMSAREHDRPGHHSDDRPTDQPQDGR